MFKTETFFGANASILVNFLNKNGIGKDNIVSVVPIQTAMTGQVVSFQLIYWEETK